MSSYRSLGVSVKWRASANWRARVKEIEFGETTEKTISKGKKKKRLSQ